ncbi:N-acetylated-alpha-linked acidic dipeptidase 2-like isoform X2 [Patiria miniata]|uniref:glutamate carboxypeptidase II n=1 Tax=Patiria miniata TaxID=46514 RepID=A0A914BJB1_PATMI|nr:N-acetylated-alpha-linked acidic dipeptidase 2-like isoform X2 [Patiria miniata]
MEMEGYYGKKSKWPKPMFWGLTAFLAAVGIGLGVIIGHFTAPKGPECAVPTPDSNVGSTPMPGVNVIDPINAANIEENLRYFTKVPHIAGSPAERSNAEYIRDKWIEQGLDSAKLVPYDVLLSYPNDTIRNKVSILEDGNEIFHSRLEEAVLRPGDDHPDVVPPFNAYSYQGEPEGDLVYANYARVEDFEYLEKTHSDIKLNGTIIIARYGKIFRGNKALNAQAAGAKGLILYSDPADYAIDDGDIKVYPDGWWLPETGAQRGNTFVSDAKGDPVTPGYPAKPFAFRIDDYDTALPKIPVHPIGYGDAQLLLGNMTGEEVIDEWKGHLPVTYRLGPGFNDSSRNVKMTIHTTRETRTTYDVIGFIRGEIEPDRYVVIGNHRDAWVYGAVDPSSGTAAFMEVSRVFGELRKSGWKPRRSIVFGSWGAEEYGLLGSTEFVEEFQRVLAARAVAYINVDSAVTGNYSLSVKSTPLLYQAIYAASKKVPDPEDLSTSLYDTWRDRLPADANDPNTLPRVSNLGAGSDFAPFMYRIGVSAVDLRYRYDPSLGISSYPVYHSVYETFYYMKTFLDYDFLRHQAVARLWAEVARDLAESVILPFDCTDYVTKITGSMDTVRTAYEAQMAAQGITFDYIYSALANFSAAATEFEKVISQTDMKDLMALRRVNDQLMQLERAFIDPLGLPDRKFLRHIVFAPSSKNYYAADAFPGIVDAMYRIDEALDQDARWDIVKQQMAVTTHAIQSAVSTLQDVLAFDG